MKTQPRKTWLAAAGLCAMLSAPAGAVPLFVEAPDLTVDPSPVFEYYHAETDHYFITTSPAEVDALESVRITGWKRVGDKQAFYVFDMPTIALAVVTSEAATHSVCRFYIPPASHFMSASKDECNAVADAFPEFVLETDAAFHAWLPDSTGRCPRMTAAIGGFEFQPVYRLWNNRVDTNHRLTTSKAERAAMIEQGWVPEGYGDEGVAMCVPHWD